MLRATLHELQQSEKGRYRADRETPLAGRLNACLHMSRFTEKGAGSCRWQKGAGKGKPLSHADTRASMPQLSFTDCSMDYFKDTPGFEGVAGEWPEMLGQDLPQRCLMWTQRV